MQGAVHRQPLYFHKYEHFIRLAHSKLKIVPVLLNAQFKAHGATFWSRAPCKQAKMRAQTRAQRSALCAWADNPGSVADDIHPWPSKRQRCSVAATFTDVHSCSGSLLAAQNVFTDVPSKQAFGERSIPRGPAPQKKLDVRRGFGRA